MYFAILMLSTVFLIHHKIYTGKSFKIAAFSLLFVLFSTIVRFATLVEVNIKDMTEVGRLMLPVILLLFKQTFNSFKFANIVAVFFFVSTIDFLISVMEFFYVYFSDTGIYNLIRINYWSESHWVSPYRTNGLTPGPGQHAVFGISMLGIALVNLLFNSERKGVKALAFLIMTLFITISSLSRTALLVAIILILITFALKLTNISYKKMWQFFVFMSLGLFLGIKLLVNNKNRFSRVFEIFETGLNNHTMTARTDNWSDFFGLASEYPIYILIGWGKQFFGEMAKQTDNEYLFIGLFYGVPFLMIFMVFLFRYIFLSFINYATLNIAEKTLVLLVFSGLFLAIPSAFFFQVQSLVMLTVLIITRDISLKNGMISK